MAISLGIDLGTTNSVAAVATPTGVEFAKDANGNHIHPSVVSFPAHGGMLVGHEAAEQRAVDPTNTIYSAKRLIGQNIRSPLVQLALTSMPFAVEEGPNQQAIIIAGDRRMPVTDVSAQVIVYLKKLAEKQFDDRVEEAVITVPANFSDAQRQATKEAGRLAGLDVMRLVNEPTAAALAYGYGQQLDEVVGIFDFGGGTFDVSVLKIRSEIFEVLATDGDFFLGGDDLDRALAEHLASELNRTQGVDPRPFPGAMTRLMMAAEQVKCFLSTEEVAEGSIDGLIVDSRPEPLSLPFQVTRREFDNMIVGYVDRTIEVCRSVMVAAGIEVSDLSEIICVGGSTRVPLVRQRITELFGREPSLGINPDEVVGHGAAIHAGTLSSDFSGAEATAPYVPADRGASPAPAVSAPAAPVARPLLMDVTPASLRIATVGDYTEQILEKNAPIPIERGKVFSTAHNDQTRVVINCCRGEAKSFEDNEEMGTLTLEGIPAAPRGESQIEVTFRVDTDGILHVRARDKKSGKKQEAALNVLGAPIEKDTAKRSGLSSLFNLGDIKDGAE